MVGTPGADSGDMHSNASTVALGTRIFCPMRGIRVGHCQLVGARCFRLDAQSFDRDRHRGRSMREMSTLIGRWLVDEQRLLLIVDGASTRAWDGRPRPAMSGQLLLVWLRPRPSNDHELAILTSSPADRSVTPGRRRTDRRLYTSQVWVPTPDPRTAISSQTSGTAFTPRTGPQGQRDGDVRTRRNQS